MAKRLYNTFEFIGEIVTPNDESNFYRVDKYDNSERHSLGMGVKAGETNVQFLSLDGWLNDRQLRIYTNENKNEYIDFKDRFNEDVLARATNLTKIVVDFETDFEKKEEYMKLFYKIFSLEVKEDKSSEDEEKLANYRKEFKEKAENRHEFLSMYDVVQALRTHIPLHKDKIIRVTGNIRWSMYKGKIYRNFEPKLIEFVSPDTKHKLEATIDVFFNRDSLDESAFKDNKKVYLNGFVMDYDSKVKGDRFFPQQFVIDGTKIDMEDERQAKILKYVVDSVKVKGRAFHHLQFKTHIFNGAEIIESDELSMDSLTDHQKTQVELGLAKLSDFAQGVIGDRVEEIKLILPLVSNEIFADGAVEYLGETDFLELVVQDEAPVTIDEVVKKKEDESIADDLDAMLDDEFADLLG